MSDKPKVRIRPFTLQDAPSVHRWFNNKEATRTLMEQRERFTEEDAAGWTERAAGQTGPDRKFAIEVEGFAEPVGFTALYGLFAQMAPELGCMIGDDVRGKGVGRRAEAQTVARAFDEFGAHRVYGRIPSYNEPAKRAVASMGWRHEGTLRSHVRHPDGKLVDLEVWGVLPDEFRAAAAANNLLE